MLKRLLLIGRQSCVQNTLCVHWMKRQDLYGYEMPNPTQLILNPKFSGGGKGWIFTHASIARDKRNCVELAGGIKGDKPYSSIALTVDNVPAQHLYYFSCDIMKAEAEGNIMISIYACDEKDETVGYWFDCCHAFAGEWTTFNSDFVPPPKTTSLYLWVQNYRDDATFVRKPSLTLGKSANTSCTTGSTKTVILEANYKAAVCAEPGETRGTVYFPIPSTYREQIPISFELTTTPKSALLGWKIYPREDGLNWLCEAHLAVGESVTINWKSLVVVKGEKRRRLKKELEATPESVSQWLRGTEAVQSDDPAIKKKARAIVKGTQEIEEQARRIMRFCVDQPYPKELNSLDAKTALMTGGSCTSRANLGAALLRANGIPARTIAHLPVMHAWCDMHWLTEYWHPGYGWTSIETSMNKFAPPANQRLVLSVSSCEDEDKARDALLQRIVLPGAPYLSIFLVSKELSLGYGYRQNFAAEVARVMGTKLQMEEFYKVALRSFDQLTNATYRSAKTALATDDLVAALKSGKATKLSAALKKRNHLSR